MKASVVANFLIQVDIEQPRLLHHLKAEIEAKEHDWDKRTMRAVKAGIDEIYRRFGNEDLTKEI